MQVVVERKHHRLSPSKKSSTEVVMEGRDTEVSFTLRGELIQLVHSAAQNLMIVALRHEGIRHPDFPTVTRNTLRRSNPTLVDSRAGTANLHRAANIRYAYQSTRSFSIGRHHN